MGFLPVILGIPKVMRFLEISVDYITAFPPDIVVLIDYPGFNLYFATYTKRRKIPTVYYVTPQIWAWAPWRIQKIRRLMTKMLVIFPFEVPFYERARVPVEYVGHPLIDKVSVFQPDTDFPIRYHLDPNNTIALLPGSRHAQIRSNLPVMLWLTSELARANAGLQCCIALVSLKYESLVLEIVQECQAQWGLPEVQILVQDTYNVVYHSRMVLVTSGTSTLEVAVLGKPMVILYRIPWFHKWVVAHTSFLKCRYFGLPNLVSDRQIVPEHLITEPCPKEVLKDVLSYWSDTPIRKKALEDLARISDLLQGPGASRRAAQAICRLISPAL
jgi:lipid-A-disaccharide synthase